MGMERTFHPLTLPLSRGEGTQERSGAAEGGGSVSEPSRLTARWRQAGSDCLRPENGAVSEKLVYEAAREAYAKSYTHLYVIGFAIQPNARELIDKCDQVVGVPATYVQATPDLMMGDLLKNMRSSQIFSVCGLPEVRVQRLKSKSKARRSSIRWSWSARCVDPATMEAVHRGGNDVPAWFLDTDYNGLCFHVSQAFFHAPPRGTTSKRHSRVSTRTQCGAPRRHDERPVRSRRARADRGKGHRRPWQ